MLWSQSEALPRRLHFSFVAHCLVRFVCDVNNEAYAISKGEYITVNSRPVQHPGNDGSLFVWRYNFGLILSRTCVSATR